MTSMKPFIFLVLVGFVKGLDKGKLKKSLQLYFYIKLSYILIFPCQDVSGFQFVTNSIILPQTLP